MLDSILQKRAEPVNFEKIILSDEIITDKNQIKEAVCSHFNSWTKSNPPNDTYWEEWKSTYSPINNIQENIYNNLLTPITITELQQTIKLAPRKKATGPLGISNEALQHLPLSALTSLLNIMNNCLTQETIPD